VSFFSTINHDRADLCWTIDRYWGDSSPYLELTTENLQQLTLENSIADLTYFAKNVKLPFDTNSSSNAQNAV
jgi:hypothetical protein